MSQISCRKLFLWWKILSLFSTKVKPNMKKTPGELLNAFYPSLEASKVFMRLYPALAKGRFSSLHSMLIKFCFEGIKKLRSLLMNFVFFIESSSLWGVKRFPSRISLMATLYNLWYKTNSFLTSSTSWSLSIEGHLSAWPSNWTFNHQSLNSSRSRAAKDQINKRCCSYL